MLSHRDKVAASKYITDHPDEFLDWSAQDKAVKRLAGAEIALIFGALVGAVQMVGTGMDSFAKVLKHTRGLMAYARDTFGKKEQEKQPVLALRERVLVLLFEQYARTRKGMSAEALAALVREPASDVEAALKELASVKVIRLGKGGWTAVY